MRIAQERSVCQRRCTAVPRETSNNRGSASGLGLTVAAKAAGMTRPIMELWKRMITSYRNGILNEEQTYRASKEAEVCAAVTLKVWFWWPNPPAKKAAPRTKRRLLKILWEQRLSRTRQKTKSQYRKRESVPSQKRGLHNPNHAILERNQGNNKLNQVSKSSVQKSSNSLTGVERKLCDHHLR